MKCLEDNCNAKVKLLDTRCLQSTNGPVLLTRWQCELGHWYDTSCNGGYYEESG